MLIFKKLRKYIQKKKKKIDWRRVGAMMKLKMKLFTAVDNLVINNNFINYI